MTTVAQSGGGKVKNLTMKYFMRGKEVCLEVIEIEIEAVFAVHYLMQTV